MNGETLVNNQAKRYEINYLVYGGLLTWKCSPELYLESQSDNYVYAYTKGYVEAPWIEAVVTSVYGTKTSVRKELLCKNIKSAVMRQQCEPWWEDGRKRYAFYIQYEPGDIPLDQMRFCWSNNVSAIGDEGKEDGDDGIVKIEFPHRGGLAGIDTEGDVVASLLDCSERLIGPPMIGLTSDNTTDRPSMDGIPIPDGPTEHRAVNYARVTMPQLKDPDVEYRGYVRCIVNDNVGNSLTVVSPYELVAKWNTAYHVAPNPADDMLTVTRSLADGGTAMTACADTSCPEPVVLNLYDNFGLVRTVEADISRGARMDTTGLPDGTYYLNILKDGQVVERQVVLVRH